MNNDSVMENQSNDVLRPQHTEIGITNKIKMWLGGGPEPKQYRNEQPLEVDLHTVDLSVATLLDSR